MTTRPGWMFAALLCASLGGCALAGVLRPPDHPAEGERPAEESRRRHEEALRQHEEAHRRATEELQRLGQPPAPPPPPDSTR